MMYLMFRLNFGNCHTTLSTKLVFLLYLIFWSRKLSYNIFKIADADSRIILLLSVSSNSTLGNYVMSVTAFATTSAIIASAIILTIAKETR